MIDDSYRECRGRENTRSSAIETIMPTDPCGMADPLLPVSTAPSRAPRHHAPAFTATMTTTTRCRRFPHPCTRPLPSDRRPSAAPPPSSSPRFTPSSSSSSFAYRHVLVLVAIGVAVILPSFAFVSCGASDVVADGDGDGESRQFSDAAANGGRLPRRPDPQLASAAGPSLGSVLGSE